MNRRFVFLFLAFTCAMLLPYRSPAPLIYTPGEGWTYEPVGGGGNWQRTKAKDQLIVAQDALDKKDYSTALRAAHRTVKVWPLSDFAPQAQFIVGQCYEAKGEDERAFKEYQKILEKYPRFVDCDKVLARQYEIANRFLGGQWFRLWTYIPFFPSMEKTADMYGKIVKDGPFSTVAPQAQMKIGEAREKQKNFPDAAKAYETAADRYHDRMPVAADALFRAGLAYQKQAQTAEYDQSTAGQAIATFTDFITLYPDDPRVPEAQTIIASLKTEQARGNFAIGLYYESHHRWDAARIYFNEVVNLLLTEPNSYYATQARIHIEDLNKRIQAKNVDGEVIKNMDKWMNQLMDKLPQGIHSSKNPLIQFAIFVFAATLFSGCGYTLGPTNGLTAGEKDIQITPFLNHTFQPRLGDSVTTALRQNIQRDGTYHLATRGNADIIVTGVVTKYTRHELNFEPRDVLTVKDFRVNVEAQVTARNVTSGTSTNWTATAYTLVRVGSDLTSAERQAMPVLADELAKNITGSLVDGSW